MSFLNCLNLCQSVNFDCVLITPVIKHRELAQLTVLLSPLLNWFGLGMQLGIYYHELKKIDIEERGSVDRCLAAMLQRWMKEKDDVKVFGGATKEKLVSALKEIKENALSEAVAQATLGKLNTYTTLFVLVYVLFYILSASVNVSMLSFLVRAQSSPSFAINFQLVHEFIVHACLYALWTCYVNSAGYYHSQCLSQCHD